LEEEVTMADDTGTTPPAADLDVDPFEVAGDVAEAMLAAAPLRYIQAKARSATRQARDDVGRWRKIYYRLRRSQSAKGKVADALRIVKKADWDTQMNRLKPHERIETVRKGVKDLGLTQEIDERVAAEMIKDAQDAATIAHRLDALGPETMVSIGSLPQDMQDALNKYLTRTNLEPRITKHFGPFSTGKVRRSVKDILNLLDRVIVDSQDYAKGYDLEHK
jgi:hypothetical protein